MLDKEWRQEIDQASYSQGYALFVDAASAGDVDKIKYCVEQKKLSTSHDDAKPLKMAAYYGHLDAVKYLHKNGNAWDLSDDSYRPICYAASQGHYDVAEYLVENVYGKRACLSPYMLADAALNGQNAILRMFMRKGVGNFDNDGPWLLKQVAETKHYDTAEILLEAGAKSSEVLEVAVRHDNRQMLTLLLDYEIEDKEDKALKAAREKADPEMVHLLHQHKRKSRKLEIMTDMLENRKDVIGMFLENCTIDTLNVKRDSLGNTGLLLLAKQGLFFSLCHQNPEVAHKINMDDLYCRNIYHETVISVLSKRGQLNRLFSQDMWLGRRNDVMDLWSRLNDAEQKQVDFDTTMSRITKDEMRQNTPTNAIKMKRRPPSQAK